MDTSSLDFASQDDNQFFKEVLDKGHVQLVEYMGDDFAPVKAARISYGRESKGYDKDIKLLDFLMRNHHHTPFEMIQFKFIAKCPIFVARQWFRHRMGSFNEISGRYTKISEEFYIPSQGRTNSKHNKQSSDTPDLMKLRDHMPSDWRNEFDNIGEWHDTVGEFIEKVCDYAYSQYQKLLELGVAREMARMVLPVNIYTSFYWSVNARSLLHFLALRYAEDAQLEIKKYASAIIDILKNTHPLMIDFFEKHKDKLA